MAHPCRSWCLWSTDDPAPKTSRTRRCCETSPRPRTSGWASNAPARCWATWSPRPREIPPSHAGWATYCTTSHPRVMLAHSPSPIWESQIYSSALAAHLLPFCWHQQSEEHRIERSQSLCYFTVSDIHFLLIHSFYWPWSLFSSVKTVSEIDVLHPQHAV